VQDAAVKTGPDERDTQLERLRDAYERTHRRLWLALLAWSGSTDVADEAAAEAFAQAARRGDGVGDIDAWVWRSAFRIAAGELHDRRRRPRPVGATPALVDAPDARDTFTDHRSDPALSADAVDLVRALGHLSAQQRACVVLFDVAGLSAAETATALGTSAGSVRVQVFRARRILRNLLETNDD
jgi:RNA polymerase sigma-70 factor, ECF subfamily